jgi:hypothetical protein
MIDKVTLGLLGQRKSVVTRLARQAIPFAPADAGHMSDSLGNSFMGPALDVGG